MFRHRMWRMRKDASAMVSRKSPQSFQNSDVTGASDAKYRVHDYKVPVEGGEITVRAVTPGTGDEGEKYPLLFWAHGGGQLSCMFLFFCQWFVLTDLLLVFFPSRINLRRCRSRRLFYEEPFYRSSSNNAEYRISVCPSIPFSSIFY